MKLQSKILREYKLLNKPDTILRRRHMSQEPRTMAAWCWISCSFALLSFDHSCKRRTQKEEAVPESEKQFLT